jgi:hypothetical protein
MSWVAPCQWRTFAVSQLGEVIGIDSLDLVGRKSADANPVLIHEGRQLMSVTEHYAFFQTLGIVASLASEGRCC